MGILFATLSLDLLFLAGSLALYLYFTVKARLKSFDESGIPFLPAGSILENNTFGAFAKVSTGEIYEVLYRRLSPAKYGGFFNSWRPCLLIRDPDTINKMLTKDFQHFNDHGLSTDEETNPMEANLFFLSGPKWKALRRKLSPTFTSGKLKGMFPLIGDCSKDLVSYVENNMGKEIEMREVMARFTTDVIGSCAFGLEPECIKNPKSKFRQMGEKFFNPGLFTMMKAISRFIVPWFYRTFKIPTQPKDVVDFFCDLTSQTIAHRISTGNKRNDFVQLLIQLKQKGYVESDPLDLEENEGGELNDMEPQMKIEFTDKLLAAQAFVFFIAGFDTTASAISFALYLLASNPEIQERVRREVKEMKEKKGGEINYESVAGMEYLNACVQESLRIYPPVQTLPRKCTKDYMMEDGYLVKKGTTIFIPIYAIHRDSQFFPDPEEFRPERFMGEETIKPGTYLPFGYGPRMCIARRFALLETSLSIAMLLDNFNIKIAPKMEMPMKLIAKTFVVAINGGLWLDFEKI